MPGIRHAVAPGLMLSWVSLKSFQPVGIHDTTRGEQAAMRPPAPASLLVVAGPVRSSTSSSNPPSPACSPPATWPPPGTRTIARHLRVEHWANALNQGAAAGINAAGGAERYTRLPYFFSDQYDLGMEYVGHRDPDDEVVVRGSLDERQFVAFWHRHGIVTAAMNVNVWDVVEELKGIIAGGRPLDPKQLGDPAVPLGELVLTELTVAEAAGEVMQLQSAAGCSL